MINPEALLPVYVAEKAAVNLVVPTHRNPQFLIQGITARKFSNPFSTAC
jgi:hypothetical protein